MLLAVWNRLPVVVRAILAGLVVSSIGIAPWIVSSLANQQFLRLVPWGILPAAFWLWIFWRYFKGEGWPAATSQARRSSMRANPVAPELWGGAMFAGLLGIIAVVPLGGVLGRLVALPVEAQPIRVPAGMPGITVFALLVMASLVAGVVEEVAFRGYMQGPIERRHGPLAAILITGTVFGLMHFTHHPAAVIVMLPYYLWIAAVYGSLAWLTNSIWPGLILHAGGDVFSLTQTWLTGRPEWQMTSAPAPLVWQTGPDAAFWAQVAALILLGGGAIASFAALAAARGTPLKQTG